MKKRLLALFPQSVWTVSGSTLIVLFFLLFAFNVNIVSQNTENSVPKGSSSPNSTTALSGTYSVGTSGTYSNLTVALAALTSGGGLSGPVIFELQADYVSSGETFPITFTNFTGLNVTNTLTVRPATGASGLTISGDNATALIDINNGDYLTLDGRPGGIGSAKELTISNINTSGTTIRFINDATYNTLKYLTIQGVATSATVGVVFFSTAGSGTGNDYNTVDYCDIRDGATTPTTGIYAGGTPGKLNSNVTISNCNIFNFYTNTASTLGRGIFLNYYDTDWTIQGNSFYQTTNRTFSAASTGFIGIDIYTTGGNNFNITSNYIGGQQASAGGSAWTQTGDFEHTFTGIRMDVGSSTASKVNGNVIKNILSNSATNSSENSGIYVKNGLVFIGYTAANTIGDLSSTDNIVFITSGVSGEFSGINALGTGDYIVRFNNIGGITCSTTTTGRMRLKGIVVMGWSSSSAYPIVSSNIVGGTVSNSLYNTTNSQTYGIHFGANGSSAPVVDSNIVRNLNSASTGSSVSTIGIYSQSSGIQTCRNNQINNLYSSSESGSGPGHLIGMRIYSNSTVGDIITNNTIHTISQLNPTYAVANAFGISYNNSQTGNNLFSNNYIHSLKVTTSGTFGYITGLHIEDGLATVVNNIVRLGIDETGASISGNYGLTGIYDQTSDNTKYYHNSIYIGGTGVVSTGADTYAFRSSGSGGSLEFKNNISVNVRSNASGGAWHTVIRTGSKTVTSNFNLFYHTGTGFGFGASGWRTTFSDWKTATSQDANSLFGDPKFHTPANLHVLPTSPASNAGVNLSPTVTTDFDGETRSATPDIGADEFTAATASSSGSVTSPTLSILTAIVALVNPGGVEINPASYTSGASFTAQFFGSGRSGSIPAGVTALSPYYWVLSTDAGSLNATIRFYFNQIASNGVSVPATLKLFKRDGSGSAWVEITSGISRTATYIEVSGLTSFSEFVLGGDLDNPLPVELVSFTGKAKNRNVILSWETKTEIDNLGFEVERKDNSGTWMKTAFVEGHGTSNAPKYYNFEDKKITSGKYSYRLKQIDNNGSFEYSDEVEVTIDLPTEFAMSQNYPNPFNPSTKVDYQLAENARVTIELYGMTGERVAVLVSEQQEAGYYSMMIDAFKYQLTSGIYIYRMIAIDATGKNFVSTKKLSLIK